jgi:hypothetical protein
MKSAALMAAVLVLVIGLPVTAHAQEYPLDLAITDINYACLGNDSVYIEAEVQLAKRGTIPDVVTEVRFYIDGSPVSSVVYDVLAKSEDPCETLPTPCNTEAHICYPAYINDEWVTTVGCWEIILFDPPASFCACMYLVTKPTIVAEPLEPTLCTVTIDPEYHVAEWDEDNNSMTVSLGPSPTRGTQWGMIKSLYR